MDQQGAFRTATVSSIALPPGGPVRDYPRPPEFRQPGYEEAFDHATLFYDIYRSGDRVELSGPPLLNLRPLVAEARFQLDGATVEPVLEDISRTQRSHLVAGENAAPRRLSILSPEFSADVAVQPDENRSFAGRRVVTTKSRNNDLRWIADWASYHVQAHKADAVLLYDNGSDRYGVDDVLAALKAVAGLKAAVVVAWPFKWGPTGGPHGKFDSDFSQYGIMEHARRRFLRNAAGVLNVDIDELVVVDDGRSLFDMLERTEAGGLSFRGRWIEGVADEGSTEIRHRNYRLMDPSKDPCPTKWAAVPARFDDNVQFRIHDIGCSPKLPVSTDITYRHFRAISTGWKVKSRVLAKSLDPNAHVVDEGWLAQMRRIGWAQRTGILGLFSRVSP